MKNYPTCKELIIKFHFVVGAQKNCLNETVVLSNPNICLKQMGYKIFTILHLKKLFI